MTYLQSMKHRRDLYTRQRQRQGKAVVVVGAQWGDEGKGKMVDLLAADAYLVTRFQGGPNAGHTLVVDGETYILSQVPSGAMHDHTLNCLGQGTVLNAKRLRGELSIVPKEKNLEQRLFISQRANVITPMHRNQDVAHESAGKGVGSTRNGIRPAYEDRVGRRAVTFGDFLHRPLVAKEMLRKQIDHWGSKLSVAEVFEYLEDDIQPLAPMISDTGNMVNYALNTGQNVLFEGAQGTLLDPYFGTYPFVTSFPLTGNAAFYGAGVGIPANAEVIGVAKLLNTRVGDGPHPTQLVDEDLQITEFMNFVYKNQGVSETEFASLPPEEQNTIRRKWSQEYQLSADYRFVLENLNSARTYITSGQVTSETDEKLKEILGPSPQKQLNHITGMHITEKGDEFGARTGRPRRPGKIDLPQLKYSGRVNGMTGMGLTKLDVLGDLESFDVCIGYELAGKRIDEIPLYHTEWKDIPVQQAKPIYETFPGFSKDEVKAARKFSELPENAQALCSRIGGYTKIPIDQIGVGPDREETLTLRNAFTGEEFYG